MQQLDQCGISTTAAYWSSIARFAWLVGSRISSASGTVSRSCSLARCSALLTAVTLVPSNSATPDDPLLTIDEVTADCGTRRCHCG